MRIVNQPYDDQLGNLLLDELESGGYKNLVIMVAFAKLSGVLRLKSALEKFREDGGVITTFVGIDHDGTSFEALAVLFQLSDALYVVHTQSARQTFHPKVYELSNSKVRWTAIGSNNLTGGGLWTNFETFVCHSREITVPEDGETGASLDALFAHLMDGDCEESMLVSCEDDIRDLLFEGYVSKEVSVRIKSGASATGAKSGRFGTFVQASMPALPAAAKKGTVAGTTSISSKGQRSQPKELDPKSIAKIGEVAWFETRAMTGGSGNILDLSMTARVTSGSAAGTRFDTGDPRTIYGGVHFFDIDTTKRSEKNVKINYDGVDYYPCTIKIHDQGRRPNGSWRIQLRGTSAVTGDSLEHTVGSDFFKHKVLAFEAIGPDYYAVSVFDDVYLDDFKQASRVVAQNGAGVTSKFYGLL